MSQADDLNTIPPEVLAFVTRTKDMIVFALKPMDAWTLTAFIQFVARAPIPDHLQRTARGLGEALITLFPANVQPYLERGWDAANDIPLRTNAAAPAPQNTVEVHNVWTIYGVDEDGKPSVQPFAEHSRPQDWGDQKRWSLHRYRYETEMDGKRYINNLYGWTDLPLEPHQYAERFASLLVIVLMPGSTPELCGREYLHEDDFWDDAWGAPPPFYDETEID